MCTKTCNLKMPGKEVVYKRNYQRRAFGSAVNKSQNHVNNKFWFNKKLWYNIERMSTDMGRSGKELILIFQKRNKYTHSL